jgi:hypothetical protein
MARVFRTTILLFFLAAWPAFLAKGIQTGLEPGDVDGISPFFMIAGVFLGVSFLGLFLVHVLRADVHWGDSN